MRYRAKRANRSVQGAGANHTGLQRTGRYFDHEIEDWSPNLLRDCTIFLLESGGDSDPEPAPVEWPDLTDPAIGFCGSASFQSVVMMNACALVAPTGLVQGGVNHRRCDPQPLHTRDRGLGGDSSRRANNRGAAL
jgi:hypothetical protein